MGLVAWLGALLCVSMSELTIVVTVLLRSSRTTWPTREYVCITFPFTVKTWIE